MQDYITLKDIIPDGIDTKICSSYCQHHYLLPVGRDLKEIHWHNNNCRKDHLTRMIKWQAPPPKRKDSKPKSGRHMSQQLACMCTSMHCTNSLNGEACFKCSIFCMKPREEGSLSRHIFDESLSCTCDVCKYQYCVLFYRQDSASLAVQVYTTCEERTNLMSQTNLNAF